MNCNRNSLKRLLLRLTFLVGLGVLSGSCACANHGEEKVKTIEVIKTSLEPGVSSSPDVEACLRKLGLEFSFVERSRADKFEPKFHWKSVDPRGYFVTTITGVRTHWWKLASQNTTVYVEIDSKQKVAQITTRESFTAW